jgi:hypothetical protein
VAFLIKTNETSRIQTSQQHYFFYRCIVAFHRNLLRQHKKSKRFYNMDTIDFKFCFYVIELYQTKKKSKRRIIK